MSPHEPVVEFELNLKDNKETIWFTVSTVTLLVAIFILAFIGSSYTIVDNAGNPQILSWSGWRLLQAQHAYDAQLSVLRGDAMQLAAILNQRPEPVATQLLFQTISNHTANGDPSLASARSALAAAALDVRNWSTGITDQASAIQSLQNAFTLLR